MAGVRAACRACNRRHIFATATTDLMAQYATQHTARYRAQTCAFAFDLNRFDVGNATAVVALCVGAGRRKCVRKTCKRLCHIPRYYAHVTLKFEKEIP